MRSAAQVWRSVWKRAQGTPARCGRGDHHAVAQVAGPQGRAAGRRRIAARSRARSAASGCSFSARRRLIGIVRRPCRDFGPVSCPATIARRTWIRGCSASRSASVSRSAIASEIRSPVDGEQLEQRPPRHRGSRPADQPAARASGTDAHQTRTRGRAGGAAAGSPARAVADQAGACGVAQAGLQGQHGVADRAVAEPMPVLVGQPAQPVDEASSATLVDVAQPLLGREVARGRR